jgi:hypothetical protein
LFEPVENARADLKAGTLYAIAGQGGWTYYAQVTTHKEFGFFRKRDRSLGDPQELAKSPVMAVIMVGFPSVGRALRSGLWKKLGRFALREDLTVCRPRVQWPAGTLKVTVWEEIERPAFDTMVSDPAIQMMEIMAVWDAEHHIPARLTADFGEELPERLVGGPIWRERKLKEETASRHPDSPWHQLPPNWVPTDAV